MSPQAQQEFISDLIGSVQATIASKKIPPDWGGIELRQYIADKFSDCVITGTMDKRRMRDYRNVIATTNL